MEQFVPHRSSSTTPNMPQQPQSGLDFLASAAALASPAPSQTQESEPNATKKMTKRALEAKRDWVWTTEMEVELLQFVMGAGVDVRDYYQHIIKYFGQKYNIQLNEAELKMRFTHLRGVQKAVLEKFGRPLPGPVKYAKKKKKSKKQPAADDEVDEVLRRVKLKRAREDTEEENEDEYPATAPQNSGNDGILMLLRAGEMMEMNS